jgi:hypothetical protein
MSALADAILGMEARHVSMLAELKSAIAEVEAKVGAAAKGHHGRESMAEAGAAVLSEALGDNPEENYPVDYEDLARKVYASMEACRVLNALR